MNAVMAASLAFASSCDSATALKINDLIGDWQLVHLYRTETVNGLTFDAMQDGTSSLHMTVAADGTTTTVMVTGGAAPVNGTGVIDLNTNKMVLDGQAYFGNFVLNKGEFTVDCGEQAGLEEFSRITFVFVRP
jgi:hypothetical protein